MLARVNSRLVGRLCASIVRPLSYPSFRCITSYTGTSSSAAPSASTSTTSSSTSTPRKLTIDRIINQQREYDKQEFSKEVEAEDENIEVKITKLLEQELKIQQAALRRSSHLSSYLTSHGYTVTQHDNQYRWTRVIDNEFHVTVTCGTTLPEGFHVKVQKTKSSTPVPSYVMELTITLNIQQVSITDPHHPHPLVLMPAPHLKLTPYTTIGNTQSITNTTGQNNNTQYQGWMCDCCGTASTSYSYHCQRGCEYDLLPSCISSIPDIQLKPQITACTIKNVTAQQSTDIPLNTFGEEVRNQFNVFLESVGIDQQLARHVWLYCHEAQFASPQQAATTTEKVETLTALRNFFAQ